MPTRYAYLYVFDTLGDWEPGYLTAELNSGRYFAEQDTGLPVRTVGLTRAPITTMGGLSITPDATLAEITPQDAAILILPGGDTWLEPQHEPVLDKARELLGADVVLAAICGATLALANTGMLDERRHTSNNLDAMRFMCPHYAGAAHYRQEPAVTDGKLVTASGLAPLEFAKHAIACLGVFSEATLEAWHRLNTTRETSAYSDLMESLPEPSPG